MDQRVSLITLGVTDLADAARFYDALGWTRADDAEPGIVVYDLIGQSLCLYPREHLAKDIGIPVEALGTGGTTLAYNVETAADVTRLTELALAAGAKVLRPAGKVFWGGTISYISDPDGHIWEFAHNPFSALGPDGAFRWGGY